MDKTQREINEAEWHNPENWKWIIYFSKRDSRVFVPLLRSEAFFGQFTLNLGHRMTLAWLAIIAIAAIAMVALA
jgi:uncharacterized membrane protein